MAATRCHGEPLVFVRVEATNYQQGIEPNVWQLFQGQIAAPRISFSSR